MDYSLRICPSKAKKVSFGTVTIVPIARRVPSKFFASALEDAKESGQPNPPCSNCGVDAGAPSAPTSQPLCDKLTPPNGPSSNLEELLGSWSQELSTADSQQPFTESQIASLCCTTQDPIPPVHADGVAKTNDANALLSLNAATACAATIPSPLRITPKREDGARSASPEANSLLNFSAALDDLLGTSASPPPPSSPPPLPATPPSFARCRVSAEDDDKPAVAALASVSAARTTRTRAESGDDALLGDAPLVSRRLESNKSTPPPGVCIFCDGSTRCQPTANTVGDRKGTAGDHAVTGIPLMKQDGLCFHAACAVWCPEVYGDAQSGQLLHVTDAWERSRCIKCVVCRRGGAAIGCVCATCQLSYHIPCALRKGSGVVLDQSEFALYCPLHKGMSKAKP